MNNKSSYDVNVISFNLCYITKIPQGLTIRFPNLHTLIINSSNLKVISKHDLAYYRNLQILNFDSNQIEFLPGDLLEGFYGLSEISFNNNNLRVIEPNIFENLHCLNFVDFRSNPNYNEHFISDRYNPNQISPTKLIENLFKFYFERFRYSSSMQFYVNSFEHRDQRQSMDCEIAELRRLLEAEKLKKSNLNLPHHSCFCSELKDALKDDNNFKDFTILIENEVIHVNKLLLTARSPVFAKTIQDNPNADSFNLGDISVETFKEVLNYLYTDTVELKDISSSMLVFAAANRFEIKKLVDIAVMNISGKITAENVVKVLFLSNKFEHDKLRQRAFDDLKKYYPKIAFKEEWAVLPEKVEQIVEAFKEKEEKLQEIEQQFQNLLAGDD